MSDDRKRDNRDERKEQVSDEVLIELIETQLGRGLTTIERQRVTEHLAAKGIDMTIETLVGSLRTIANVVGHFQQGKPGLPEVEDSTPMARILELQLVAQGKLPVGAEMSEMFGDTSGQRTAMERYLEPIQNIAASSAGVPSQFTLTGEYDAMGRPIIEGEIDGQTVVWDANLQQVAAAIILDDEEAEDLPDYLGGIPQGTELPQNLGDVATEIAERRADWIRQDEAERAFTGGAAGAPGGPIMPEVTYGEPIYMPGDQWTDFATKDPGYIRTVQESLVAAGLMSEDDISSTWTGEAAKAMQDAMTEANWTGGAKTWVDIVQDRARARAEDGRDKGPSPLAGRVLVLPQYSEPDPAALDAEVRQLMASKLGGRDPLPYELAILGDYLSEQYRAKYDAEIEMAKAEFEAGNRAILRGGPTTETVEGDFETVDPSARLAERIEERYAPEIELNEDRAESRANVANALSVFTRTTSTLRNE